MPKNYIDRCVEAAQTVDAESLSELSVGRRIGSRGSEFTMRTLGRVSVLHGEEHLGLKIPDAGPGWPVERRILQELEAIELLLEHMPELSPAVPRFLALLSVDEEDPLAVLTEDASQGGKISMRPFSVVGGKSELAGSIAEAFAAVDGTEVDRKAIDYLLAFMIGDRQRLLDFTPPPVWYTDEDESERISDGLYDLIEGERALTVDIGSQSPLGVSLAEHFKQ
jgi:hypothetical protein